MCPPAPTSHAAAAGRGPRWLRETAWGLVALVVAACFYSPARQLADTTLDNSNYASYAYFTAKNFQFGSDVVPMAGPYGFVPYGFLYAGQLFWKRFPLELLTKLVLGVLAVWFVRRSPDRPVLRWLWLAAFLAMAPLVEDLPYDFAILFAGLGLVESHVATGRRSLLLACGLAAYVALLTLFKGTQAMMAVGTLGLLGMQAVVMRRFSRLAWIAGAYLLSLAMLLGAAGQNPLNLPGYFRGVLELSSGYNAAMVLEEPLPAFLTGAGALLALGLLLLMVTLPRWRQPAALAGAWLLAGFTFVEWKHGFVRADGHVYIFYQYACIAAPTILLFAPTAGTLVAPRWHRILAGALALVAVGLGLWSDGQQPLQRHLWATRQLPIQVAAGLRQITTPAQAKLQLDAGVAARRELFELPLVRATVGSATIDYFGTELGYLMLNRLNYRPRPMGGGTFNVFTAWLQERNLAYVANPATRPEFFLVSPGTIDHRFLAQDDPGTLRALLELYSPVASEQGLVLFRARPGAPALPGPRTVGARPIVLGEPIELPVVGPGEMLLVSFSLPPNLPGRLRAFLYKPPLIFMDLEGAGIANPKSRRLLPGLMVNPVPLNPVIEDLGDLLSLYRPTPGKTARTITVHTSHPELFATAEMQAIFYAAPRPEPEAAMAGRLTESLKFPVANVAPGLVEPANAPPRRFDGLPVQMLEPPGRIRFPLTGGEKEIRFMFGLDPAAYSAGGQSDGVEFFVDLERPGQAPQTLFRRWLRPRTQPAERGTQVQRVVFPPLPLPPGSTVSLRTGPGGDRDGAWDWAYFSRIQLLSGGYLPEQFPRFARLPASVSAQVAGPIPLDGRELFMLNSPGSVTFTLLGSERKLVFTAGLLAGAYSNGGQSDGVEFIVELRRPDATITRVYAGLLNPRDNPRDRGDRRFEVPLPAITPGTLLILSAAPGPGGSDAWDWSYIESLRFD